jgi:hypothetical protein
MVIMRCEVKAVRFDGVEIFDTQKIEGYFILIAPSALEMEPFLYNLGAFQRRYLLCRSLKRTSDGKQVGGELDMEVNVLPSAKYFLHE